MPLVRSVAQGGSGFSQAVGRDRRVAGEERTDEGVAGEEEHCFFVRGQRLGRGEIGSVAGVG